MLLQRYGESGARSQGQRHGLPSFRTFTRFLPMDTTSFEQLRAVVRSRRTIKAVAMNGRRIPDAQVQQLLELADWAPTHGQTEPWRFFVYAGESLQAFGRMHADLYWSHTEAGRRQAAKRDKLLDSAARASHLIMVVMKRDPAYRVPEEEEMAAVAAAIQNVLLGATAMGIASFWSTGGMARHPALRRHLQLGEEDRIVGLVYLGYTDEPDRKGQRKIPLADKTVWHHSS